MNWADTNGDGRNEQQDASVENSDETDSMNEPADTSESAETVVNEGRYTDYDEELVAADGFDTTILFFHAEWCPECRAFEQALMDSEFPDGVQILKVDYDAASDLKKRHSVTTQTTFVRVDQSGETQATWVGYGRDKSLDVILENTA